MNLTIITACSRPENLQTIFNSMNFDYIDKWIIVYDTTRNRVYTKQFTDHTHIIELECSNPGVSGNAQRNYGLTCVKGGFIYLLDDDNMIHPEFWSILPTLDEDYFYTWDQLHPIPGNPDFILKGGCIELAKVDTAMFIVPKKICKNLKWNPNEYSADFLFIKTLYDNYPEKHIYIPKALCYYNKLST